MAIFLAPHFIDTVAPNVLINLYNITCDFFKTLIESTLLYFGVFVCSKNVASEFCKIRFLLHRENKSRSIPELNTNDCGIIKCKV